MMTEHFKVGHRYPEVKIHTSYSYGLDDQEFVLGFETDSPERFLELVIELRGAEQRPYTERGRADLHLPARLHRGSAGQPRRLAA